MINFIYYNILFKLINVYNLPSARQLDRSGWEMSKYLAFVYIDDLKQKVKKSNFISFDEVITIDNTSWICIYVCIFDCNLRVGARSWAQFKVKKLK